MFLNNNSPWLGQVPLVLGPSSWGAGGGIPIGQPITALPSNETPPYYGEWGVVGQGGKIIESGSVGPYSTSQEAFEAAAAQAIAAGATELPTDGFAQVKDSRGQSVGPVT